MDLAKFLRSDEPCVVHKSKDGSHSIVSFITLAEEEKREINSQVAYLLSHAYTRDRYLESKRLALQSVPVGKPVDTRVAHMSSNIAGQDQHRLTSWTETQKHVDSTFYLSKPIHVERLRANLGYPRWLRRMST